MSDIQEWREETQNLTLRVREAIADAAIGRDFESVDKLTNALSPLQELLGQLIDAKRAWRRQMDAVQSRLGTQGSRASVTRLQIVINWRASGRHAEPLTLQESTAGKTLARLIDALVRVLGSEVLPKLRAIPVGSASLVSRQPEREFINPKTGEIYGHQPIGVTGWHVHTHTSNSAKIDQIERICILLSLPEGMVTARMIPNPS